MEQSREEAAERERERVYIGERRKEKEIPMLGFC